MSQHIYDVAAYVAAVSLTVYWVYVILKLIRLARKIGKDPNAMPRERVGQLMRVLWYPCIFALLAGLWIFAAKAWSAAPGLLGPIFVPPSWWVVVVVIATVICISFTAFTFVCWRKMGRSWRIGIDPGETLALVSSGPYKLVRHPIYALRMAINVCAFLMAPSLLVLVTAAIDFILLQIEARREERYMLSTHGNVYANYQREVGRFVPRLR